MESNIVRERRFLTSREAADRLGFSRADSLVRSWRAAGLPIYRRRSGRLLISEADLTRFVSSDLRGPE